MASLIRIPITGEPAALLARARTLARKEGARFEGDERAGTIAAGTPLGEVSGSYRVEGAEVVFAIERKPFVLPLSTIESRLRSFLGA